MFGNEQMDCIGHRCHVVGNRTGFIQYRSGDYPDCGICNRRHNSHSYFLQMILHHNPADSGPLGTTSRFFLRKFKQAHAMNKMSILLSRDFILVPRQIINCDQVDEKKNVKKTVNHDIRHKYASKTRSIQQALRCQEHF